MELSEKTKAALQNIGAIITGVITNADKAVETMDESMKITASGVEIMKKAKTSTAEITTANKEMGIQIKSVNQESVQALELNKRLAEIVESIQVIANKNLDDMQNVYDASQAGLEASKATSDMVDKLNEVAGQLAEIIARG